jgi:hypothetical protein
MKKKFFFIVILFLATSCSSSRFQNRAVDNIDELIEFKEFLIKAYPNGFANNSRFHISNIKNNKILYYCHLFKIDAIYFISKEHFRYYKGQVFNNEGNGVKLFFSKVPFFGRRHVMWFDYSEDPLILKNDTLKSSEVAKGIFVF